MKKIIVLFILFLLLFCFETTKVLGEEEKDFVQGWNYLVLKDQNKEGVVFDKLPEACVYVVYQKDSWFYSFVRGYSEPGSFVLDQQYYIYCLQEANWQ